MGGQTRTDTHIRRLVWRNIRRTGECFWYPPQLAPWVWRKYEHTLLPPTSLGLREAREAQGPQSALWVPKVHFCAHKTTILPAPLKWLPSLTFFDGFGGPGAPKVLKLHFGALWELKTIDLTWENIYRIALGN